MKTQNISFASFFIVLAVASTSLGLGAKFPDPNPQPTNPTPAPTPTPTPAPTPAPENPPQGSTGDRTPPLWEAKHTDGKNWTLHVLQTLDSLGKNILDVVPADAATFCPKYKNFTYEQRKDFWAYLISAMVRYESNFKPETSYQENFKDSSGAYVISRGLLQLSFESSKGYQCGFANAQEIHDPYKNLSCGIRILDRWLDRDGRIAGQVGSTWQGGARYWSVLRSSSKSYTEIVKLTTALPVCK